MTPKRIASFALLAVTLVGCAAPTAREQDRQPGLQTAPQAPRRVVVAIMSAPPIVAQTLNPGSHWRGVEHIQALVDAGLTRVGGGVRRAELAEASPSPDNGLWTVNADGTMETTWRIKTGVQWQDGTPFTSADLAFTLQICLDKEVPLFSADGLFTRVVGFDTPDPQTIVVRWKEPYIDADTLFGAADPGLPLARHILERSYPSTKSGFGDDPYFGSEHVGMGPFQIKSWEAGSLMVLKASDTYVLGRPKIDEVEIRFIEDAGTLQANVLAGSVDMTLGRNLSGPQTLEVTSRWQEGRGHLDYSAGNIVLMFIQLMNSNPSILTNVTFRRAALLALDRQSMVDALVPMQSEVANSFIPPGDAGYAPLREKYGVKYPYDPRQAAQLLGTIGYTQGADGTMRDGSGQPLGWLLRTTAGDDLREKMILTSADNWKQVGLDVSTFVIPRQQADDPEFRANFPAMELVRQSSNVAGTKNLHSRTTSLPENNYRGTGNRSRYFNKDLDGLIDRVYATIDLGQRRELMGQLDQILTTDLPFYMMLYSASTYLVNNRITNFQDDGPWNAYQWETR